MPHAPFRRLLPLAALLCTLPFAGCGGGSSKAAHGGLVPDISGDQTLYAGHSESYNFDASSALGYRVAYSVNWGDGSPWSIKSDVSSSSSVSLDHIWAHPGTYVITATVTDGHGESGINRFQVTVTPPPPPPPQD